MNTIKEIVQQQYAEAAVRVRTGATGCGCGSGAECATDPITSNLYD